MFEFVFCLVGLWFFFLLFCFVCLVFVFHLSGCALECKIGTEPECDTLIILYTLPCTFDHFAEIFAL